ncbi:hypothetical protein ACHQM5_020549 [Ranunculus cassubicifolius]
MENDESEISRKRMKHTSETGGGDVEEDTEAAIVGSEEMELRISSIMERIEQFTQQVSELLEAGKTKFKDLSNEFEERVITIHKEQMEKWQDEIKDLRLLDSSNEEANVLLQNARYLLHNIPIAQLKVNKISVTFFYNKYL